jgi:hypothetical protein
VLSVGIDWAERHHDLCIMATHGRVLARERIADRVAGVARLHELIASWAEEPAEASRGPSRTGPMRGCWPIWSAPTAIITGRRRGIRAC